MKRGFRLITIALALSCSLLQAKDEITLYSGTGKASAYLAMDDAMTIYLWNGKPVAYLDPDGIYGGFNVYGFNGSHLGWYERGVIWGHEGEASCAIKERSLLAGIEPLKHSKKMKPDKASRESSPFRHSFSQSFGAVSCVSLLGQGVQ